MILAFNKVAGLIVFVLLVASGQVLFKLSSKSVAEKGFSVIGLLQNPYLVAAVAIYGFCTLYWVWLLKDVELSRAYPFVSLTFVVVPLMSYFFLGERVGANNFISSLLIVAGVIVATR